MRRLTLIVIAVGLLCPTGARAADKLENIRLVWKPTTTLTKLGGIDSTDIAEAKIRLEALTDSRKSPELIGENLEGKQPRKVTTQESVAEFVADKFARLFSDAGLALVDRNEDIVLVGELQKFFVEETGTYNGEVRVKFSAKDRSGKEVWAGVIVGGASGWGRSYKGENYYETLSNSIIATSVNLFKNAGLRRALGAK